MEILWGVLILILVLLTYVVVRGFKARRKFKRIRGQFKEINTGM